MYMLVASSTKLLYFCECLRNVSANSMETLKILMWEFFIGLHKRYHAVWADRKYFFMNNYLDQR